MDHKQTFTDVLVGRYASVREALAEDEDACYRYSTEGISGPKPPHTEHLLAQARGVLSLQDSILSRLDKFASRMLGVGNTARGTEDDSLSQVGFIGEMEDILIECNQTAQRIHKTLDELERI